MPANAVARQFPQGNSLPGNRSLVVLHATDPPRTNSTSHTLIDISHRLRPRDYTIASLLDEHTTLTTDQLTAVKAGGSDQIMSDQLRRNQI